MKDMYKIAASIAIALGFATITQAAPASASTEEDVDEAKSTLCPLGTWEVVAGVCVPFGSRIVTTPSPSSGCPGAYAVTPNNNIVCLTGTVVVPFERP